MLADKDEGTAAGKAMSTTYRDLNSTEWKLKEGMSTESQVFNFKQAGLSKSWDILMVMIPAAMKSFILSPPLSSISALSSLHSQPRSPLVRDNKGLICLGQSLWAQIPDQLAIWWLESLGNADLCV